jgi:alkylation response protein AidB-like acyl-CoA dehydrogenase
MLLTVTQRLYSIMSAYQKRIWSSGKVVDLRLYKVVLGLDEFTIGNETSFHSHNSMRSIGVCERAMSLILARAVDPSRKPFGKSLKDHDLFLAQIAELRIEIESARLLVLNAADMIDRVGAKGALSHIAIAKVGQSEMMRLTCRLSSPK